MTDTDKNAQRHVEGLRQSFDTRDQGRRAGIKWAVTWLHQRAEEMNDDHAKLVLNSAAFNMGSDAKRARRKDQFGYGSPEEEQAAADSAPIGFVFNLNDLPSDGEPS